jgi:membrane protease YdiL (CAAX protease family)
MEESAIDDDLMKPLNKPWGINKYPVDSQILIWIGIFMGCFILAQFISGFIIMLHYKSIDIHDIALRKNDLNTLRLAQLMATVAGFLVPALLFSRLKDHPASRYSHADRLFHPMLLVIIPLMIIAMYPLINASFFVNKWMPWSTWMQSSQDEYKAIVDAMLNNASLSVLIFNIITVAAVPAICEEWIFRGTLQRILSEKMNIHAAIFIAAVLFSFIHFEFSGFLPRILLGMLLGYIYYLSGSLWASIFAHTLNNSAQILLTYLNTLGMYKANVDVPEMPSFWELVIYSIAFIALCRLFYYFTRHKKSLNFA